MRTKMIVGVFRFKDAGDYRRSESLKDFSQFHRAENFADKCWQKEQCYGGFVVRTLELMRD